MGIHRSVMIDNACGQQGSNEILVKIDIVAIFFDRLRAHVFQRRSRWGNPGSAQGKGRSQMCVQMSAIWGVLGYPKGIRKHLDRKTQTLPAYILEDLTDVNPVCFILPVKSPPETH